MKPCKYKIGDRVVYIGPKSQSSANRKIGTVLTIVSIDTDKFIRSDKLGPVYYFNDDLPHVGEFELDLVKATKLQAILE